MKIYFAGAIRGGRADAPLYLEIVKLLREHGEVLTEHVAAEELTARGEPAADKAIHDRDLEWLRQADCLVAEVTVPSLGVGYEIGRMVEWGKPILCLYRSREDRTLSAMIAGGDPIDVRKYQKSADLKEIFDEFFLTE
jgi:nucleoside 2-deoxyribosyltransferase